MRVILRLNSNKQVLVEVVRALKAENKVCLIFVAPKQQQKISQTYIEVKSQQISQRCLLTLNLKEQIYNY